MDVLSFYYFVFMSGGMKKAPSPLPVLRQKGRSCNSLLRGTTRFPPFAQAAGGTQTP